ncbi:MAG TPA: tetratricopeptide repeat protein [Ktedonobacteraceae bacterium]|nr:tetratricopeptide repeat protein [Ktedonobacteraceae bacterium]
MKVQKRAREALRLVPNDPGWLATQQQAQSELAKQAVAYNNKGNTLERLGKKREAQQAYARARQLGSTG